ncbi:MAG: hypothetical protein WC280_03665 [Patescibacteria group bacterium]
MNFERPTTEKEESFFSRKLDEKKVLESLAEANEKIKDGSHDVLVLKEKVSERLNFEVETSGRFISFYLKDENNNSLIDFKYKRAISCLSQVHREVKRGELKGTDINSSMFLSKVEEFLTIMVKDNNSVDKFLINTGQKSVIEWARRNGYKFIDKDQIKKYNSIIEGEDDNYIVTDNLRDGDKYDKYIMTKDKLAEAEKHLEERLKEGDSRDNIDLRHFSQRFDLLKRINKEDK